MNWLIFLTVTVILLISIFVNVGRIMRGDQMLKRFNVGEKTSVKKPKTRLTKSDEKTINEMYGHEEGTRKASRKSQPHIEEGRSKRDPTKGRRWKIIITNNDLYEKYEFIFRKSIGIGRIVNTKDYEEFLTVKDPKVSKLHCSIFSSKDALYIQDEGSSNFTFLNKKKVKRPEEIQKEDIITIGNTTLEIVRIFKESR